MIPQRILIVNPFGIGDVLFTLPLVSNLRHAYPQCHLAYIGNRRTAPLLRKQPVINQVFSYDRDEFVAEQKKSPLAFMRKWKLFYDDIKREKFDLVFDLSMNAGLGLFLKVCGIPKRVGFNYRGRGQYLTDKVTMTGYEGRHVVEYYMDLLRTLSFPVIESTMKVTVPEDDMAWALQWLQDNKIKSKEYLIVVPGGGVSWGRDALMRRWPTERYLEIIKKVLSTSELSILLIGDAADHQLFGGWVDILGPRVISLAGQTSIVQAAALMKNAKLAFINDSGLVHLAVACQVPTIAIYGPVNPKVYGPYPLSAATVITHPLPCQPCYRNFRMPQCPHLTCLNALSVDDVFKIVSQSLRG